MGSVLSLCFFYAEHTVHPSVAIILSERQRERERERESKWVRASCCAVIVFLIACGCWCSVAPPCGTLLWSAVEVFLWYILIILSYLFYHNTCRCLQMNISTHFDWWKQPATLSYGNTLIYLRHTGVWESHIPSSRHRLVLGPINW